MDAILGVDVDAAAGSSLRATTSLSGAWWIRIDPDNRGMAAGWAGRPLETNTRLTVPGCVQSLDDLAGSYPPAHGFHNSYKGTVWLERAFPLPTIRRDQRLWLKLGGVAPAAHLWFNGHYVGYHGFGPVSAKWDVTNYALAESVNRVSVAVVEQEVGLLGGLRFDGQVWSGIYRAVELETSAAVHVETVAIKTDAIDMSATVTGEIHNDGTTTVDVTPSASATPWPGGPRLAESTEPALRLRPGEHRAFRTALALPSAQTWSTDAPHLNLATVGLSVDGALVDTVAVRFGLRSLQASGAQLLINGQPFLARGVGQEYFSPTLSPLVDRTILQDRARALKACGFNFFRCHTYPVTPEELDVADEMGLVYSSEISLVSNLGLTEPFSRGLGVLKAHIEQTRNHPSLGIVCLGNAGSQVMVDDEKECRNAILGYDLIRATAHNSLAMIAFGLQGELPDLPNDIESPHLWSHDFRWAYDGLTRIPWRALRALPLTKPSILHEVGKFGVWPDPAEHALYPAGGYIPAFGGQARAALVAAGLDHLEDSIIANARRLHDIGFRGIIEQARRQPGIAGYTLWTAFRGGERSGGFVDDLGQTPNVDPVAYREGCNAPLAVLIDRDLTGRTLPAGADTTVGLHLSNFGGGPVNDAVIEWRLRRSGTQGRDPLVQGRIEHVSAELGQNRRVGALRFDVPHVRVPVQAVLEAAVLSHGATLARNHWDLWLFPTHNPGSTTGVITDLADRETERRLAACLPGAISLRDLDSALRGCRSWDGIDADCLARARDTVVIADRWSETVDTCLALGRTAILLDTGHLPPAWYPPPVPSEPGAYNVLRSFTSFRAGWDQGNIATVIEPHPMLGDFPHEGFCDLQCLAMVQDVLPVRTRAVAAGKAVRSRRVIFRNVPKLRKPDQPVLTEDRCYLIEVRVGAGRLIVCTLRCLDDPAGLYLLSQMLNYADHPVGPAPRGSSTTRLHPGTLRIRP